MTLRVTVLGSSGMFSTQERACAGYLVEIDDFRLWMEAGAGTWQRLTSHIEYPDIDGVMLSHRHPDHTSDVFQAFHARHYGSKTPLDPIPLWAPAETIDRICGYTSDIDQSFDIRPIAAGQSLDIAGARFSFHQMAHPCETVGIRVETSQGTLAYSSDTGPEGSFHTLAREADLFICEATLQDADDTWEGHMRASQAAAAASDVGALKLLLTHLPPGRDHGLSIAQAQAASDGPEVQLASDGLSLEVGA